MKISLLSETPGSSSKISAFKEVLVKIIRIKERFKKTFFISGLLEPVFTGTEFQTLKKSAKTKIDYSIEQKYYRCQLTLNFLP